MKVKITESVLNQCFREALDEAQTCACEERQAINEALSPGDVSDVKSLVKKEIKDFLKIDRSVDLEKKIEDIVRNKLKGNSDMEKYVVDIVRNVTVQLYKSLWTRRNFWTNDLKNQTS